MGATDKAAQQPRHRGLGTFLESEVEHACARDRARFASTDAAPSFAHISTAIPQAGARDDAAALFEHEVVAPSVDALPPIERRISGRSRRAAPKSFVERIFEPV